MNSSKMILQSIFEKLSATNDTKLQIKNKT